MVDWGAGPRAGQFLIQGGKALAAMDGRFSVAIDDIKKVAIPVLRHRISTNFQAQAEGKTSEDIIQQLLADHRRSRRRQIRETKTLTQSVWASAATRRRRASCCIVQKRQEPAASIKRCSSRTSCNGVANSSSTQSSGNRLSKLIRACEADAAQRRMGSQFNRLFAVQLSENILGFVGTAQESEIVAQHRLRLA